MSEKTSVNWAALEAKPEFRALLAKKKAFIVPAFTFCMLYYLALPVLIGYFPEMMKTKVWGEVNVAYVFAFSQFILAWLMAFLYVRAAAAWDKAAAAVIHGHH